MLSTGNLVPEADKSFSVLGPQTSPSGAVMMDVKLDDEIFNGLALGDYGYESDSDLEDEVNDEGEKEDSDKDDKSIDADITGE